MNKFKISVLIRSADLIWNYKNANSRDFWEALTNELTQAVGQQELSHESKGSYQHHYYLFSEKDKEYLEQLAHQVLDAVLSEDERKAVIISVTQDDLKQESDTKKSPVLQSSQEQSEQSEQSEQKTIQPTHSEESTDKADEPVQVSLSDQAKKIDKLKTGLLSKIRGQRHAVDEVVQSIFECEMFASRNPKRKGPLATFLFTGPSGVGKTFLAQQCGELLERKMLVVNMSEYSDNLANLKFNGEHGQTAVVTGFVRDNPNGIIVFDEIEKAHLNTIHLFLQILDAGILMDHQLKKDVSFRDNIIIMTTNAGKSLYDDTTVCDLSGTPRSVILEALRTDKNPQTGEPYFPECITTRMANGHVILFNHLEPYSLMEIIRDELALQIQLFEQTSGIKVEYDQRKLSALVLYNGGGIADARTLRGLARSILVQELQEIIMQLYADGADHVNALKTVTLSVDVENQPEVDRLFVSREKMYAAVFADGQVKNQIEQMQPDDTVFEVLDNRDLFKRRIRGVTDYVLIDPLCGNKTTDRNPNDIEDIRSEGMDMFNYIREFSPEIPVYILDTDPDISRSFDTLLGRGARGIISVKTDDSQTFSQTLKELSFSALINNAVYSLSRSGKYLSFNCAQYIIDPTYSVISFEKLQLRSAPRADDNRLIARKGDNNDLKFSDIIGCRSAKQTLSEYCKALDNPRQVNLSGKRMPKGVLLYGPPGTGKTMLAKAMANECGATFLPVSATSFFGSLVGQTEGNIRDIFKKARKYAPSIIFVDEVDAIGRRRSGSASTSHNEDALNTFLAEMDGFVTDEKRPVFILAATNYELEGDGGRVLDPAFVRRFDSKLLIPLPDTDERYEFLVNCLQKHGIHFGPDHEAILRNMAKRTGGMSNADLDMMNAQFVRAIGDGEPDRQTYMDTLDAFRFGEVNKMNPEHLRQTACHEAGHALVCRLCGTTPSFLTVVSRGGYGGFMESAEENHGTYTFGQLMDLVCRCLAGRLAEIEIYGEESGTNTGASSDIKKARYYIKSSLSDFAMGQKLFVRMDPQEAEDLIQQQYQRTADMLRQYRKTLEALTDLLTEKKSLDQNQLEEFFANQGI